MAPLHGINFIERLNHCVSRLPNIVFDLKLFQKRTTGVAIEPTLRTITPSRRCYQAAS